MDGNDENAGGFVSSINSRRQSPHFKHLNMQNNVLHVSNSFSNFSAAPKTHHRSRNFNFVANLTRNTGSMPYDQLYQRLNFYYGVMKRQLMTYQDEASGLFRTHDNGTTAHVRDNIYCAVAMWSLSCAYKRLDNDNGRSRELSLCAVKTMRRILMLWMNEAERLEQFKQHQSPENALHCKFHYSKLLPIRDDLYNHLQIDAVGLYVIFLTQMITSGLDIVYTSDEVNFVQNLVFYLERAYRTPDFGVWERGDKYNVGQAELHASSIGTAKVALECINAFNLFGMRGASLSVAYVDVDAHSRNRTTLESMLPRESNSKNTDAALLCTLGFPVFASHASDEVQTIFEQVQKNLAGRYGFKRFLRDGYGTHYDDDDNADDSHHHHHRYYNPSEIHKFDGIEPEWPIFFAYLIIDGVFRDDHDQVEHYQSLLEPLLCESSDEFCDLLLPKYYYVPAASVEAERDRPGSQNRLPSGDVLQPQQSDAATTPSFLWGQAVFIISQLLVEGLVNKNDIDPLHLHLPSASRYSNNASSSSTFTNNSSSSSSGASISRFMSFSCGAVGPPQDLAVQVCLISECSRLQRMLATYGIASQTPAQVEPVQIWSPTNLMNVCASLGRNEALGLSGRPKRPFGLLSTSKIYRVCGLTAVCYPLFMDVSDFYLSYDIAVLMDDICSALSFVARRWPYYHNRQRHSGSSRPTIVLLLREDNFSGPQGATSMVKFLASLRTGKKLNGVNVKLGTLQTFLASSCVEQLDFIDSAFSVREIVPQSLKERRRSSATGAMMSATTSEEAAADADAENNAIFELIQRGQTPTASGRDLIKRRISLTMQSPQEARTPKNELSVAKLLQQFNVGQLNKMCEHHVGHLMHLLRTASSNSRLFSAEAALILCALYRKEGPHLIVEIPLPPPSAAASPSKATITVKQLLERTIRFAASNGEWLLVRFCSAVLRKVVDSLAPSITSMLVRGKVITVGVFGGKREIVIDKPITPADLARAIYDACGPYDLTACCIQQEVVINLGKLIEAHPNMFDGILKIRVGWIVQAMAMYKTFTKNATRRLSEEATAFAAGITSIDNQPPAVLKELAVKVLCLPYEHSYVTTHARAAHPGSPRHAEVSGDKFANERVPREAYDSHNARDFEGAGDFSSQFALHVSKPLLTPHQRRQIDGCLGRVPEGFYDNVWHILECGSTAGLRIANTNLPQQPTLTEMTLAELRFALKVDALLSKCTYPAYRQLVVELLLVVNLILERNRECRFFTVLDTDELVTQGLGKFVAANGENGKSNENLSGGQKFSDEDWQSFYNQSPLVTANFFAAAVVNRLLEDLRTHGPANQVARKDFRAGNDGAVDFASGDAASLYKSGSNNVVPSCALS